MVSAGNALDPGPGNRGEAPSGGAHFYSALSGSRFFKPPTLPEVMTFRIE
jgi:hypothetical protein